MQHTTTVRLIASDPALFRKVAVALAAADYHILADTPDDGEAPDVVLRHWSDTDWRSHPDPVPVLTLDLGSVSGQDLVHVVERVLGHRNSRETVVHELGQLVAEFRSAGPSGFGGARRAWRAQN
jgi:hypothetical protein